MKKASETKNVRLMKEIEHKLAVVSIYLFYEVYIWLRK
jgi:hypothetical protein